FANSVLSLDVQVQIEPRIQVGCDLSARRDRDVGSADHARIAGTGAERNGAAGDHVTLSTPLQDQVASFERSLHRRVPEDLDTTVDGDGALDGAFHPKVAASRDVAS